MKHRASFISCLVICLVLICYRGYYADIGGAKKSLIVTQWDAFGYYLYLPATVIYHDYKKLDWAGAIDKQYNVTGGGGMPVVPLENGNKVSKYFGGVALMQAPLFCLGHIVAHVSSYPPDGFSPPYQYALAFGVLLYCILAIFLLRRILLRYFSDAVVAITLLLLCLATNFVQYAAVDNGLSHAWIFPLYVLLLYTTIRWHEQPAALWAFTTGLIIGLATICRPTEAIIFFIPLLWNTHIKEAARAKWALVKSHRLHVLYALLGGLLGVLPQLLYWRAVTGSYVYDVGSKWVFLNPWFRVLTGWEKGWFIYTPVTIAFIAGLFFMKRFPFRKSVLVFCLLNIWIVISWEDWRYGASYSARALMQSYPVFALPLAAITERMLKGHWRVMVYTAGVYLTGVNLFQIVQYNNTILHYNDMNRRYYSRIYLNPDPSPLDMSLLDTDEWLSSEKGYSRKIFKVIDQPMPLQLIKDVQKNIAEVSIIRTSVEWVKVEADIQMASVWSSRLVIDLRTADSVKQSSIRLDNPVGKRNGQYACYVAVPQYFRNARVIVSLRPGTDGTCTLKRLDITCLKRE